MAIKCRLKEILKDKGITQVELGENVGMSKQAISNIVNNRYSTPLDSAYKISRFLNMSIEDIFIYEEDK